MTKEDRKIPEVPQKYGSSYMSGGLVFAITAFILVLFTGGIAYSVEDSKTKAEVAEGVLVDGVREFVLSAQQWYFNPGILKVNPGERVRFIVKSNDIRHGFALNELGVNLALSPTAQKTEVAIPPDMPDGLYTLYCSIFCGIGHPYMKGNILIGEPGFELGKFLPFIATLIMAGMFFSFIIVRRREVR